MTKNKKIIMACTVLLIAVIIVVLFVVNNNKNKNEQINDKTNAQDEQVTSFLDGNMIDIHGKLVPKEKDVVKYGEQVVDHYKCLACHAIDGQTSIGPNLGGLYGSKIELKDGSVVVVDENYLKESIIDPQAKIRKGQKPIMPPTEMSEEEINAVVKYIMSLK